MIENPQRRNLVLINIVGGLLVLGSYAWGAVGAPDTMASLWGGVPVQIRPVYTINMLLSAGGYFLFAPYILFRIRPDEVIVGKHFGYRLFSVLFTMILIPSACWLPLTAAMLLDPSLWLWLMIRVSLVLVGIGSVGLFVALSSLQAPRPPGRRLALIGLIPFCFQTAVLDALVWPAYFTQ
jgi:hypothetical protein